MRTIANDVFKRQTIIIRESGEVTVREPGQGVLPLAVRGEAAVTIGTVADTGRVWMTLRRGGKAVTVVMPPGGVDAVCEVLAASAPIPFTLAEAEQQLRR